MNYIGMTERGDAGIDFSWHEKLLKNDSYAGAILITKAPSNSIFQAKALDLIKHKPAIVHAGITGWGQTPMEPVAKNAETSLRSLRTFIDNGFPARNIVIRIDPIIPSPEGIKRAQHVVTLASEIVPDIERIRISIYDDYHNSRAEIVHRGYQPIDNITKWKSKLERRPTPEQVKLVAEALLEVARPGQIFELCAEPELAKAYPDQFHWYGCLSRKDCAIMGIEVPKYVTINNQKRFGCRCLMMKRELLNEKKRCPHNCAYCYWGQN